MNDLAVFVYSDELLTYKFNDEHPFNQKRLLLTLDLLRMQSWNWYMTAIM